MKKIFVLFVFALTSIASLAEERDGILIHLSHGIENPHRVSMAFKMAELASDEQAVLVYLDIEAVNLVLTDAPDIDFRNFGSVQERVARLISKGVTIIVCPSCLEAAGHKSDELAKGVQVASLEAMLKFTSGRIITLDY